MMFKQIMILITLIVLAIGPNAGLAKDELPNGLVDDSIRDMSIVFGTGLAGAVLGLSTLSFVDQPSQHTKNIAVGGAIGVVIGVAVVIFYQASKNSIIQANNILPLSAEQFASISKKEIHDFHNEEVMPKQNDALRILLPF